jgi:hypothetical protein
MVGVNVSPGWDNTVDGRNLPQMERVLTDFRPHSIRLPWVNNAATHGTVRWAVSRGLDVVVIDHAYDTPEVTVGQIAALGITDRLYVEGVNEPDIPATGFTPTEVPIGAAKLAQVADRQARLYETVAGHWPVLSPSAVYRINEPTLGALPSDIVSIHRYAPQDGTPPELADAARLPVEKPAWVTETGFSSYKKGPLCLLGMGRYVITPQQQADYLVQMNELLVDGAAARVFVYSLQNTGQNPCKAGNNWGLYTWDGVAKPAAVALRG